MSSHTDNDDLQEDAVPSAVNNSAGTGTSPVYKPVISDDNKRYPKEYDYVLLFLPNDLNLALEFDVELRGYGLEGCLYNDDSIKSSLAFKMQVHEYACECSTNIIIIVTQNLCKALKLFSQHGDEVFKHAKYAALYRCLTDKNYKTRFIPYYPTSKRKLNDVPFSLGPLAGLERESHYFRKHMAAIFGLMSHDNYKSFKPDPRHSAQVKKEERRRRHEEDEQSSLDAGLESLELNFTPVQSSENTPTSPNNNLAHTGQPSTVEGRNQILREDVQAGDAAVLEQSGPQTPARHQICPSGQEQDGIHHVQGFYNADGRPVPDGAEAMVEVDKKLMATNVGPGGTRAEALPTSAGDMPSPQGAQKAREDNSLSSNVMVTNKSATIHHHYHVTNTTHHNYQLGSNPNVVIGNNNEMTVMHGQVSGIAGDEDEDNIEYVRAKSEEPEEGEQLAEN